MAQRSILTRSAFQALDPRERMELVRTGMLSVTDDPEPVPRKASDLGENEMSRDKWDALTPFAKSAAVKAGKTIIDAVNNQTSRI